MNRVARLMPYLAAMGARQARTATNGLAARPRRHHVCGRDTLATATTSTHRALLLDESTVDNPSDSYTHD